MKKIFLIFFLLMVASSCASSPESRDTRVDSKLDLESPSDSSLNAKAMREKEDESLKDRERRLQRDVTDPSATNLTQI